MFTHTTATDRIMQGFLLLGVVVLASILGYHFLYGLDWLESTWLVMVSITGVGYGEESVKSPAFQLFTIFVVTFGFIASAYAFTGLVQLLLAGEFERLLGRKRMEREVQKLRGHVIICGFGRLGGRLADDLMHAGRKILVIESDPDNAQAAMDAGLLVIEGDATDEDILVAAGLHHAKSLVTSLPSDADNVFITLTARGLNKEVQIISRAEQPHTERKLLRAGATKVVMPSATSARHMVRMITRPSTAHLIDLMGERNQLNFEMDEVRIPQENPLVGKSVRDSHAGYTHKVLIVAVKQTDDSMVFNPGGSYQFQRDDVAIVMGKRQDIDSFCRENGLAS